MRSWELWSLPRSAVSFVVLVDALYLAAIAVGVATTSVQRDDVITFAALATCGLISVEASLRLVWRRPQVGDANNLLAVWAIPVALLLPPVYSAVITIPFILFAHLRLFRVSLTKVLFNTACGGVAGFAASTVHGELMPHSEWTAANLAGSAHAVAATLICIVVRLLINMGLVAEVVALTRHGTTLKSMFAGGDKWGIEVAESCTGILVALACTAAPYAILVAVPPVLVLQRALLVAGLREAARTDAKTGLANSGYWREVAERELARARGGSDNLAVLLVDIDHFKLINDRFGHLTGDEVLRTVANGLTHGLRPHDLVGRFGGEEFVVLLVGSDIEQGQNAAERIREHIAALDIDVLNRQEPVRVTISIGVAAFRESGHSVHELLDAADGALYAAKHAGRNCVRLAEGAWQQVLDITEHEPHVIDLRSRPARVD
jgi:diguanylate cyclase (GGDEF)-like protein